MNYDDYIEEQSPASAVPVGSTARVVELSSSFLMRHEHTFFRFQTTTGQGNNPHKLEPRPQLNGGWELFRFTDIARLRVSPAGKTEGYEGTGEMRVSVRLTGGGHRGGETWIYLAPECSKAFLALLTPRSTSYVQERDFPPEANTVIFAPDGTTRSVAQGER